MCLNWLPSFLSFSSPRDSAHHHQIYLQTYKFMLLLPSLKNLYGSLLTANIKSNFLWHSLSSINSCFSNFSVHQNHLERLLKQIVDATPTVSNSVNLQQASKCIYNKFPGDATAAGWGTTLWEVLLLYVWPHSTSLSLFFPTL